MRQPIKFEQEVLNKYGVSWHDGISVSYYTTGLLGGYYLRVSPEELAGIVIKEAGLLWNIRVETILDGYYIVIDREILDKGEQLKSIQGDTYDEAINALIQAVWGD